MHKIAKRAFAVILLALVLVGGMGFFVAEFVTQAESWAVFSGSPHVYTGSNINCGVITDRNGTLLLDMRQDRTYSPDSDLRKAMVHWLGDRYGYVEAPALSYYSSALAGFDLLDGVYAYGETAGMAELTLSAKAQKVALQALGSYKGTVAVYNYKTGELLCAVSTPAYDPDNVPNVEEDSEGRYEGMYLNRFTQSKYIPGSIFKVVTLAAALEEIPDILDQTFVCTGSYQMGADQITCEGPHYEQNIKSAFLNSCNCAFAQVSEQLGGETLEKYVEQFGITRSLSFDGITTAEGNFQVDQTPVNVAWSAIGQYLDEVNPCAFLTFVGAIANGGQGVMPYVVERISVGSDVTYQGKSVWNDRIMDEETAALVQNYMRNNVLNKYGDWNFGGLTVCAKTGTGEVGGDKKPNAMLCGYVQDEQYPLAFVVCVEDGGYGKTVCIPIAAQVLQACKESMDQG